MASSQHRRSIQQQLLRDDAYIIGAYNADPRDHARTAAITATSAQPDSPPANVITGQTRSVITSGKDASIGSGGGIPASQARLCLIRFPRGLVLLAGCCCYGLLLWWVVGVAGCWFGVMISFVQFREGSWQTVSRTGDSVHVPHAPRGCWSDAAKYVGADSLTLRCDDDVATWWKAKNGTNRWISVGLPASISLALPAGGAAIKQVQLVFDTGMHRTLSYATTRPTSAFSPTPP
jgi:hypothetical protein